jgi:hypothetical protein
MDATAVSLVAAVVFGWGHFSTRLGRADLIAPIVFVTVGLLLSEVLNVIEPGPPVRGLVHSHPGAAHERPAWGGAR